MHVSPLCHSQRNMKVAFFHSLWCESSNLQPEISLMFGCHVVLLAHSMSHMPIILIALSAGIYQG